MADNPTDPLVALERENRALRERVSELERTLRRFEDGSSRPLGQGLSEREALLVEAERIAHVGSWVWDVRTDQVIWSDELFRILGYDPSTDEATTAAFFARVHPADVDRVREASQRGIATGVSRQVDFRVLRPDGSVRFVTMDGALLFDAGGTLVRAVGTVLDVTGAVHTSDELRQAANRLAEAQRIGRMGSWEWNLATGEVRWSEELHRILDHPVGQPPLTLEEFERLVHPEDRERIHEAAIRSTTEAGATSMDMRLVLPDGSLKHVHVQTVVEPAHDGRPIHRGTLSDVTERARLEEALREAQKLEAIGRLAGGIAHDFNNLLMVILANLRLIARQDRSTPVDEIEHATLSAAKLTSQLLAFGRRAIVQPRVGSLVEMTRDALTLVRRTIGEHITVAELAADDVSLVNADPSQVEQMVLNLALNARDAMPSGGTLTFAIHSEHARNGPSGGPTEWAVLAVSDTGTGMDEATRERIFEPFFTTKPAGRGTGLGLPMVFGAMKQLGGFVEVDSGVGRGSTFRLHFPRIEGVPEADATTARGAVVPRAGRVLLIEDDPAVARVLASMLEGAGFALATHLRPTAALEQWRPGEHDVIVTDVVMPGMTGTELVRKLREREPALRALFVTGYASHGEVVPTEPGRTGLLTKPFRRADLFLALGELLGPADATDDVSASTGAIEPGSAT